MVGDRFPCYAPYRRRFDPEKHRPMIFQELPSAGKVTITYSQQCLLSANFYETGTNFRYLPNMRMISHHAIAGLDWV